MTSKETVKELKSRTSLLNKEYKDDIKENGVFEKKYNALVSKKTGNALVLFSEDNSVFSIFYYSDNYNMYKKAIDTIPAGMRFYFLHYCKDYEEGFVPSIIPVFVAMNIPEKATFIRYSAKLNSSTFEDSLRYHLDKKLVYHTDPIYVWNTATHEWVRKELKNADTMVSD